MENPTILLIVLILQLRIGLMRTLTLAWKNRRKDGFSFRAAPLFRHSSKTKKRTFDSFPLWHLYIKDHAIGSWMGRGEPFILLQSTPARLAILEAVQANATPLSPI